MRAKKIFEDEEFRWIKLSDNKHEKYISDSNFMKYIQNNDIEKVKYILKNNIIDCDKFGLYTMGYGYQIKSNRTSKLVYTNKYIYDILIKYIPKGKFYGESKEDI